MVQSCCAIDCVNRRSRGLKSRFFKFPFKCKKRLALWVRATKRVNWQPTKHSTLCERHFQKGEPSSDPEHPDYVPNVFSYTKGKKRDATLVEMRKQRALRRDKQKMTHHLQNGENATPNKTATSVLGKSGSSMDVKTDLPLLVQSTEEVMSANENSELPLQCETTGDTGVPVHEGDMPSQAELFCEFQKLVKLNYNLTKHNEKLQLKIVELQDEVADLKKKNEVANRRALISQTLLQDNSSLTATLRCVQDKLVTCEEKLKTDVLSDNFLDDNDRCKFYTYLPNKEVFMTVLDQVQKRLPPHRQRALSLEKKLLIVLVKMRLNLKQQDLAYRFHVSGNTISFILRKWMPVVGEVLGSIVFWPGREKILNSSPECFQGTKYQDCMLFINCFEVRSSKHSGQTVQSSNYSRHKSGQTLKILVGIAPNGAIIFISQCWVGRTSDKEITCKSGLLELLNEGDVVLVDKGFLVHEEFITRGIKLIMPSFKTKKQLNQSETMHKAGVSNVRIHIDRIIGQLRNFEMLNDVITCKSYKYVNAVIQACAGIINLNAPIV